MGIVKVVDAPKGMEGITEKEASFGNAARESFEKILIKTAEATIEHHARQNGTRMDAKVGIIYNSIVAINGAQRYLASLLGWHGQEDQTTDLERNVNEGSMMLSSMMLATMAREVGGSTQVSFDIQLLAKSVERTELVLGRSLDGQIDPNLLKAVRNMDDMLEKHGLSTEILESHRDRVMTENLQ